jgi:hypothetical protein
VLLQQPLKCFSGLIVLLLPAELKGMPGSSKVHNNKQANISTGSKL